MQGQLKLEPYKDIKDVKFNYWKKKERIIAQN